MGLSIIFVAVFATVGLLVSLVGGFAVGNRLTYIVFVSLLSSLCFGGLGFGVHFILEKKVPEFLDFLAGLAGIVREGVSSGGMDDGLGDSVSIDMTQMDDSQGSDGFGDISDSVQIASSKSGKQGDHIMVDKIAIKNEPKLMAEAIRTMMSKDDDNG